MDLGIDGKVALVTAASKGLGRGTAAALAAEDLIDDGITLNLLCPGLHATDRVTQLGHRGRLGDPGDFGRVAAFLCSGHVGFLSGAAIQVDGAGTLGLL